MILAILSSLKLNRADAQREGNRERERCVCVRWEWTATPCAHAAVPAIFRDCFFEGEKSRIWALFLKGKKVTKGSAMLLSWQHRASPFLQLRVRQKICTALIAC